MRLCLNFLGSLEQLFPKALGQGLLLPGILFQCMGREPAPLHACCDGGEAAAGAVPAPPRRAGYVPHSTRQYLGSPSPLPAPLSLLAQPHK